MPQYKEAEELGKELDQLTKSSDQLSKDLGELENARTALMGEKETLTGELKPLDRLEVQIVTCQQEIKLLERRETDLSALERAQRALSQLAEECTKAAGDYRKRIKHISPQTVIIYLKSRLSLGIRPVSWPQV